MTQRSPSDSLQTNRSTPLTEDRGQLAVDFAVGVGIFLLAVTFVSVFTYTIIGPFTSTTSSDAVVANQASNHFAETAFTDTESPGSASTQLDRYCVDAFFADETTATSQCRFEYTAANVDAEFTTPLGTSVSIRIEQLNGTTLTQYSSVAGSDLTYQTSQPVASDATTSRIVLIDGQAYALVVEIA